MTKRMLLAALSWLALAAGSCPAWGEMVLQRVDRTGIFRVGTRADAIPFAYRDDSQQLVGYSVDILGLIRRQIELELNKPIQIEVNPVDPQTRVQQVANGELDIVCGATSFTWERDKEVDFSFSYGITGTHLLVDAESGMASELGSPESMVDARIGVIPNTTNQSVMGFVQPEATLVTVEDPAAGITALLADQIDAFAWDGILLEGLRRSSADLEGYVVVPQEPYTREGIGCILPENDSDFRDLVNFALVQFMQDFVVRDPDAVALVEEWFGPEGITPINQGLILEFFQSVIDSHQQIYDPVVDKSP